jgi:hypothetical protein
MSEGQTRPPALWVVGVITVLLGLLGACGGLWGIGGALMQDSIMAAQQDMLERAGPMDEVQRRQMEAQQRAVEVQRGYRVPLIASQVLNVLGALALLVAAILLFRLSPATAAVFAAAAGLSALADLATAGISTVMQQQTFAVMGDMTQTGDPQADRMAQGIFQASGTFSVCFSVTWTLVKLAFYGGALLWLRRPDTRRLFE